jgi:hypothetical protein
VLAHILYNESRSNFFIISSFSAVRLSSSCPGSNNVTDKQLNMPTCGPLPLRGWRSSSIARGPALVRRTHSRPFTCLSIGVTLEASVGRLLENHLYPLSTPSFTREEKTLLLLLSLSPFYPNRGGHGSTWPPPALAPVGFVATTLPLPPPHLLSAAPLAAWEARRPPPVSGQ